MSYRLAPKLPRSKGAVPTSNDAGFSQRQPPPRPPQTDRQLRGPGVHGTDAASLAPRVKVREEGSGGPVGGRLRLPRVGGGRGQAAVKGGAGRCPARRGEDAGIPPGIHASGPEAGRPASEIICRGEELGACAPASRRARISILGRAPRLTTEAARCFRGEGVPAHAAPRAVCHAPLPSTALIAGLADRSICMFVPPGGTASWRNGPGPACGVGRRSPRRRGE